METAVVPADFLPEPAKLFETWAPFAEYLHEEGVDAASRTALLDDLEHLSWTFALTVLERFGWERKKGDTVNIDELHAKFNVLPEHARLFRRLFELLVRGGVVEQSEGDFTVVVGPDDSLPDPMTSDPEKFASGMLARYEHGMTEVGLLARCAGARVHIG